MKIIDEKGKLLGLVNIIDFIVIVLVLLVAAGVVYKLRAPSATAEVKHVKAVIMVPCVRPELAEAVAVGDKMVSGNYYTNVTVTGVEVKNAIHVNTDAKGQRVFAIDPYLKDVFVTVEGDVPISSATITLGGQEMRVGKDYYVKSLDYELKGTIFKIELSEPSR